MTSIRAILHVPGLKRRGDSERAVRLNVFSGVFLSLALRAQIEVGRAAGHAAPLSLLTLGFN